MGPKKAKKGGPQSPGEETKGGGEKMTELDKEWYLIQIKSLGNKISFCLCQKVGYETTYLILPTTRKTKASNLIMLLAS
jgi:hypothetical protein